LLVLVLLTASCLIVVKPVSAAIADSWVLKAPMHEAREDLGIAVVDDKIYALGGYQGSGPYLITNKECDPATDTPEPIQTISFPTIWIVAIAVLVAIIITKLTIYFFLKAKRTKS
jgi:hypothetical protein